MERYCGFLKRDGVRNRRKPYASLDKRVQHVAQLNTTKIKYDLVDLLSLTGPAEADGDIFPERVWQSFPAPTMHSNPLHRPSTDIHVATKDAEPG